MTRDARQIWRRVGAALPAVALIGGGAALAATGGAPARGPVAEEKPVVTVPDRPLTRSNAPSLPPLPAVTTANGIPAQALEAYQRGAQLVGAADPACGIDWALIAAIGKIESDHGRYAGNGLDASGTVRPGIFGIPLNGSNSTAVVHDSDGGTIDRDPVWDRAVGPMQFIPGTWRTVGVDADGDGVKNPQNLSDAATATAVYLCSGPGDLTQPTDLRSAILRYNQSESYVQQVIAIADGYRRGVSVLPAQALSAEPPLPPPAPPHPPPAPPPPRAPPPPPVRPAAASKRSPQPAAGPVPRGGSGGGSGSGSGTVSTTPTPETTATSPGVVGTVTGTVGTVTGPLSGATRPAPSPTSTPGPTTSTTPVPQPTCTILGVVLVPEGLQGVFGFLIGIGVHMIVCLLFSY